MVAGGNATLLLHGTQWGYPYGGAALVLFNLFAGTLAIRSVVVMESLP